MRKRHCSLWLVAKGQCNTGNTLRHREHGTGYRRSWNCCDRRTCFVVIRKHFCFILSTGTKIRIDSVMCPRSSSRGRNTSASVTVTVTWSLLKWIYKYVWLFANLWLYIYWQNVAVYRGLVMQLWTVFCRLKAMVAEEEQRQRSAATASSVDEVKLYLSRLNNALRSSPADVEVWEWWIHRHCAGCYGRCKWPFDDFLSYIIYTLCPHEKGATDFFAVTYMNIGGFFCNFSCTISQENARVVGVRISCQTFVLLLAYCVNLGHKSSTFHAILALCSCLYLLHSLCSTCFYLMLCAQFNFCWLCYYKQSDTGCTLVGAWIV